MTQLILIVGYSRRLQGVPYLCQLFQNVISLYLSCLIRVGVSISYFSPCYHLTKLYQLKCSQG